MKVLGVLNTRIGQRFLAIFLAVSLLPLATVGWFAIRQGELSLHGQTLSVLRTASDGAEAQIREFLQHLKEQTLSLSRDNTIREALARLDSTASKDGFTPAKLSEHLAVRQREFPDAREVFVIALNGRVVASAVSPNVGQDVSAAEYFRRGQRSFFPGDVLRERGTNRITWVMAAPIHAAAGDQVIGVLACRVDVQTLSALTTGRRILNEGADTQCFRIGETGETYIVNRNGWMITESRPIPDAILQVKVDTLPVRRALNEGKETTADYEDYRGIRVSGASMILPDMGWIVLTEMDFSQAFVPLQHLRNGLLGVTVGLGLLASYLAWRSARQIIWPIQVLSKSDRALAAGDETAAIVPEDGLPRDEIGDLVRRRNVRVKALFAHQRQLLLEQKQRVEAVGELDRMSYSIMHDMRAPLRAIIGFGELVQDKETGRLTSETQGYLERMKTAASRMDHLICDVLNYSRIVREEFPLGPVDIADLLRGIITTYPNLQALEAQIQLSCDLPMVLGNEAALTQCFSNLLDNAVKFAKPGVPPDIRVKSQKNNDWIRISVEDNGVGIPKEMQERIFEIFQRGTNSQNGTGIGLAIVRKAVERMGGHVGVISEPGKGSQFWIELRPSEPRGSSRSSVQQKSYLVESL
jgi:signal transduction histidine kinase